MASLSSFSQSLRFNSRPHIISRNVYFKHQFNIIDSEDVPDNIKLIKPIRFGTEFERDDIILPPPPDPVPPEKISADTEENIFKSIPYVCAVNQDAQSKLVLRLREREVNSTNIEKIMSFVDFRDEATLAILFMGLLGTTEAENKVKESMKMLRQKGASVDMDDSFFKDMEKTIRDRLIEGDLSTIESLLSGADENRKTRQDFIEEMEPIYSGVSGFFSDLVWNFEDEVPMNITRWNATFELLKANYLAAPASKLMLSQLPSRELVVDAYTNILQQDLNRGDQFRFLAFDLLLFSVC